MDFLGTTPDERFVNGLSYYLCAMMFGSFLHLCRGSRAPYGRYNSEEAKSSGLFRAPVNAKVAWIVQEAPSMLVPIVLYIVGPDDVKNQLANRILLGLFIFHYTNRTIVFPLRLRGGKPTPFYIMLSAIFFTSINGYIQGMHLTALKAYEDDYVRSPRFLVGVLVFGLGMAVNWHADHVLRNLRKPGETGYKIPHGGMFKFVSGANFLGEIVEWTGFAIACGGPPAITFALNTAFNIGPRAYHHHQWYLQKFENYHELGRCAIIPFLLQRDGKLGDLAEKNGMTPTELALSWCYHREFFASTIIGATSMAQLKENLDAYAVRLKDDVLDGVDETYKKYTDPTKAKNTPKKQ